MVAKKSPHCLKGRKENYSELAHPGIEFELLTHSNSRLRWPCDIPFWRASTGAMNKFFPRAYPLRGMS